MQWLRAIRGTPEDDDRVNSEMHMEAEIKWTQRCTWRPRSSELRDALGGRDLVNSEMHLDAEIEWIQRFIWTPKLSQLRDALGGPDRASWDMHLDAKIKWIQRCTPSYDWARLEMNLQQAMIEGD